MRISLLSIVVPIYNEQEVLPELVERCLCAGEDTNSSFELVLIDDASSDQTPLIMQDMARDSRVKVFRLQVNKGQFEATKEGLRQACGDWIVVLDGDLQDPPEKVVDLVQALDSEASDETVIFAVKEKREEPLWFLLGNIVYKCILCVMGTPLPLSAGSYCLFSRSLARKAANVPFKTANLAAVLVALGASVRTIQYMKHKRYDNSSRVGKIGLLREAIFSLFILSPIGKYFLSVQKS